jgi:hypothetical protein
VTGLVTDKSDFTEEGVSRLWSVLVCLPHIR